jgi:50S ribosomal protein L16 3-hydroxylase
MDLLGGMTPARFLADHWQKKPLLVRRAIPDFAGIVSRDELFGLATRDDVTSRLVIGGRTWERHDGPFDALSASMLPPRAWTLLVHGLESVVPGGWELLRRFDFIPRARIDDLMVSFAADGGSVGPHDDDYDVFLLQGPGRRRWQVARKYDRTPDPRAAIKVLHAFSPEDEWILEPGDMLSLPPHVAHHGVALGECFTYSIGFLAPSRAQLVESFLGWLPGRLKADETLYSDRGRKPTKAPLGIERDLVDFTREALASIRWSERDLETFVGCFLTRPKAHARFEVDGALGKHVRLALPTRALVQGTTLYMNGIAHALPRSLMSEVTTLVRERKLDRVSPAIRPLLRDLHAQGFVTSR